MASKAELRHSLRRHRQALSLEFKAAAALSIVNKLSKLAIFKKCQKIAVYLANDSEVDISLLLSSFPDKIYCLPMLTSSKELEFSSYLLGDELQGNHLGILEPTHPKLVPAETLELVCMPLVGFDLEGNRLGMGGGYYDRTFAFKKGHHDSYPFLLGIAYECQKLAQVPHVDWDIPLNGILTEKGYYPQTSPNSMAGSS